MKVRCIELLLKCPVRNQSVCLHTWVLSYWFENAEERGRDADLGGAGTGKGDEKTGTM